MALELSFSPLEAPSWRDAVDLSPERRPRQGPIGSQKTSTRLTIVRAPKPSSSADRSPTSRSVGLPSFGASPFLRSVNLGPADEAVQSSPTKAPLPLEERVFPRSTTRHMTPWEMNRIIADDMDYTHSPDDQGTSLVSPVGIPGAESQSSSPRSFRTASMQSTSTALSSPEALKLQPLAADVFLPFGDRPAEVEELLHDHCNSRLLTDLQRIGAWSEIEAELAVPREQKSDPAWIKTLERLVRPRNPLAWTHLCGLLGADDLVCPQQIRSDSLTLAPFDADESLCKNSLPSHENVFYSDSESAFSPTGSPFAAPSSLHGVGSPARMRRHNRAQSHHGGLMEVIKEEDEGTALRRTVSVGGTPSIGPDSLGLRVVMDGESDRVPAAPAPRRHRYSFGAVDLGLG